MHLWFACAHFPAEVFLVMLTVAPWRSYYSEGGSLGEIQVWMHLGASGKDRLLMAALMNIDDAHDKDLHIVFPSELRTTKRQMRLEDQKEKKNVVVIHYIGPGSHSSVCLRTVYLYTVDAVVQSRV